jgi:4-carboxymuconolactone decarboxylase
MDDVTKNRYRTGLDVRRSVLGSRRVDRAEDAATDFDRRSSN